MKGVLEPALELLDQLSPLGWNTISGRHDGEYCWIGNTDMLRSSADSFPTRYIGSRIDVTDSKRARKKLCVLCHLISTEEDQRSAWIGNSRRISVNALPSGYRTAKSCLQSADSEKPKLIANLPFPPSRMSWLTSIVPRDGYVGHRSLLDRAGLAPR